MKAGEVHIWHFGLNRGAAEIAELAKCLTVDEMERARRFHFDVDRDRFIAARGWLRKILSRYAATWPEQLRFQYGEFGKPELAAKSGSNSPQFNLSHSQSRALLGITIGLGIGVDIEYINPDIEWESVAALSFSPPEIQFLRNQLDEKRSETFYDIWTRKEAYLKALGCGFSEPTSSFSVLPKLSLAPVWQIYPLSCPYGFAAALATHGPVEHIQEFSDEAEFCK